MDTYRMRTIASYYDAYSGGLPSDGSGLTVADPSLTSEDKFNKMPKGQRDMVYLRQALLTAHELGHTLGFQHNWAANMNNRSSVMEYPTPRVKVTNGKLDLSESFMKSIGAYDVYTVRYAYTPFPAGAEKAGLDNIIKDMHDHGVVFTRDADPRYTWYDDRETPAANLKETAEVRKIALANYGTGMLKPGAKVARHAAVKMRACPQVILVIGEGFGDREPFDLRMRIADAVAKAELFPAGDVGGKAQHGEAIFLHAFVRFARAIPFQHGEFRRMQIGALAISEDAGEIEDPRFAGGEQLLRRELRRGVKIERAAVAGRRAQLRHEGMQMRLVAGRDLQDRGFGLDEVARGKPRPQRRRDPRAADEKRPPVGVKVRRPPR